MKFVASDGGPLIALPAEVAKAWRGTDAPIGAKVPAGWEWSGDDDDPIRTDYDRACGQLRGFHESSYGGVGLIRVGDGDALVFRGPTDTTFVALPDGGAFLRNVAFASPAAAKRAALAAPRWKKTRVELDLVDGRLHLIDAAWPFAGRPRPAMLNAKLGPGRYRVHACDYTPDGVGDFELRAYRLIRA